MHKGAQAVSPYEFTNTHTDTVYFHSAMQEGEMSLPVEEWIESVAHSGCTQLSLPMLI